MHYEQFQDGTVKCIEEEIPFELPDGWAWARLVTIIDVFGRIGFRGYTKNDLVSEGAITLSPSNIVNNKMDYSSCSHISWDKYYESPEIMIHNGDILLVKTGSSYGKVALVTDLPEKATINPQYVVLKQSKINASFLCYILQSTYSQNVFNEFVVGTAIPTFSQANLNSMLLMIPPMVEQKRIAYILETTIGLVEILESEKNDILFAINNAKSKILDLAIQGKLVPQDSNDEPASVLLERIRAEKEELIKAGKIKRDKKESVIFKGEDNSYYEKIGGEIKCIDDELPFELPDGWEWCNLSMIGTTNIGLTYKPTDVDENGTVVLRSCNIVSDKIDYSDIVRVNTSIRKNQYVQENDILICARNGSKALVGKCAVIPTLKEPTSFGAFMAIYRTKYHAYIIHFLRSQYFRSVFSEGNSTTINQLTQDMLKRALVPFPPQAEQERITGKIQAFYDMIVSVEAGLN